jgi:hypothetical protein
MRRLGYFVLAGVVLGACGDAPTASNAPEPIDTGGALQVSTTAPVDATFDLCADIDPLAAAIVSDGSSIDQLDPVFQAVLMAYAAEHPDTFGGLWIDREARGTIVLAFTDDPEPHRIALAARRPSPEDPNPMEPMPAITDDRPIGEWGIAFDVVQVRYTEAQLSSWNTDAFSVLDDAEKQSISTFDDITRNRVGVGFGAPTTIDTVTDLVGRLTAVMPRDALCIEGDIVDELPAPIDTTAPLDLIRLPDADGTYPPDTPAECGGARFELGDLSSLTPIAEVEPDLQAVVTDWLAGPEGGALPTEGWVVLTRDDTNATLVNIGARTLDVISAERGANGWIWAGSSSGRSCTVRVPLPPEMSQVDWALDTAFPSPSAEDTEVHLLLTEADCTSGSEIGDRLLGPQVVATPETVRILFAAVRLTGDQNCPGNPSTAISITLDEPLGDRTLVDGLVIGPLRDLLPD